jgi:MoaA/NifB/PqqE/SkfB family radical SAM enzyme
MQHNYTSTGIKFLLHPEALGSYRLGTGKTIISTHISPTSRCNLKCDYCSVTNREQAVVLELSRIQKYIEVLRERGLKAVILTGGGEPCLYPEINELIEWLHSKGLEIALITNGTQSEKIADWSAFTWVRVSVNMIDGWLTAIDLPIHEMRHDTTVGLSFVYTGQQLTELSKISILADKLEATYIRILADCLTNHALFEERCAQLDTFIKQTDDRRFFHQHKVFRAPHAQVCHQSYFRPYLCETGMVFPCDSIVLNHHAARFVDKYGLCKAEQVGAYLDGRIRPSFIPRHDCNRCVFVGNVELLGDLKKGIAHANFV